MTVPYEPEHITYIAETDYRNQRTRFGIKSRDRTRHMYVIGKSGVGKSTLLENMAIQDIVRGEGLAVLDPHGSFAEKMLDYIPQERIKDVIYFAPFDTDYPISFNVLEDVGADKRHFVASGLMSTFKKIWVDAWSARMEYILNNILLALLEYPDATLLGVNRMLSDKDFRNKVVAQVTDPGIKAFWNEEFAKYGDRYMQEAGAAIQNKIGQFTANPLIRNIIGQPKSSFDIREAMDNQKILIVNLSKGRIGEQNTALLGSMIITKIYLSAMSRADATPARLAELPNFYFYVDEFQSFANESFANILSEARKYKLALIIAHQYVAQMEESVRDAVFGNVGTSISFRVGPLDGELLEKVFAPQFAANDLINLGMAQIYLSLLINDMGSAPFSARTLPPTPKPAINYRDDVIETSRALYAHPKEQVVTDILNWFGKDADPNAPASAPYKPRPAGDPLPPSSSEVKTPPSTFTKDAPKFPLKNPPAQAAYKPLPEPVPVTAQIEGSAKVVNISQVPRPKPPVKHSPFKKAFATLPELQPLELENPTTSVFRPITKNPADIKKPLSPAPLTMSSELNTLIASLDGSVPQPLSVKDPVATPFVGEKPLRDSIPPVKLSERGPTEKNRDLLKAALLQAMGDSKPKPSAVPPVIVQKAPEVTVSLVQQIVVAPVTPEPSPVAATEPTPPPVAMPQAPAPQSTIEVQPLEIPYQTLRKVLE
jgi:hypothetical protein